MLESIFILFNILGFIFMLLSFIPLTTEKKSRDEGERMSHIETKSVIPIFAFMAFGLFILLGLMSVYIEIPICDVAVKSITTSGNISNYTYIGTSGNFTSSVLSCEYLTYKNAWPFGYLYGGLGLMMLIYGIMCVLISGFGSVVSTYEQLK